MNCMMNLTTSKLIRSGVSDSHSIEYTYRNSHIIGYVSEYYRVYEFSLLSGLVSPLATYSSVGIY